ncbi:fumarylacetoacetate hydrolase family protein [Aureibacter tunicatorum]|uniref:2-keto-4-pentenoate hydratase/2-oxohepta-3-ene-1,7-dioic acid hydratase in catechol pathway n=1 Tax=Aureibacter tunicatorum TaxID=866807 RepID=A0AAE4BR66_9BACT|nr:fumarylacetoacetate hydrolase family protein [Aureibacter tunicatorum]MDR6239904.1 2-keto-4-pentenoate hydratase/2-oxohepta-3-ene-1,7-dioic acid hydratase in catechol pathway [Aureibacter tunicatorum]BDD04379.1 2-hydroxyhepta-2,4-diene-1,7-dioate isomerase [Aureibacter tunicatorum]
MKIFGIGRNYVEHIKELNNEIPSEPVVFTKPDTALLKNNDPFYYPSFSKDVHHEVEIVIRICKQGKSIQEKFAHKYYDQIALGIDFTARDLQSKAKEKGLPWDIAKGFNGSAPISNFIPVSEIENINALDFSLEKNGQTVQTGNTSHMMYSFDAIISYLSQFFQLKQGDLIFTGTPSGVGPVEIGDNLVGKLSGKTMFDFEVK